MAHKKKLLNSTIHPQNRINLLLSITLLFFSGSLNFIFLNKAIASNLTTESNKKNVCSITINSSHEIEKFKEHFSHEHWNFIELTEQKLDSEKASKKNNSDWLTASCFKGIRCDILVVSGHFGGTFFGSSEFELSLEDLELSSCKKECSGILSHPSEVFLFGCNTLAGKKKDNRTPEEYLRVLLEDGFSQDQARQVVAYRYSQFGNSFGSRMSQVFSETPRIYGFSSKAPSGEQIESDLSRYLEDNLKNYQQFSTWSKKLGSNKNNILLQDLKNTSITQQTGLGILSKSKVERPYCYLVNDQVSRLDKIKYIKSIFESGRSLTVISYILNFINNLKQTDQASFSSEEINILNSFKSNSKIRSDFEQLLQLKGDIYLKIRIDVLTLMKDLRFITDDEYLESTTNNLEINWNQPISPEKKDLVCSLNINTEINEKIIPIEKWREKYFIDLIACLKPHNASIQQKLINISFTDKNSAVRYAAVSAFVAIKPSDPLIHQKLAHAMVNDTNSAVRSAAASALREVKTNDPMIHEKISEIMISDENLNVRIMAIYTIGILKPKNPMIHQKLFDLMISDKNLDLQSTAASALIDIKPTDPIIHQKIAQVFITTESNDMRYIAYGVLRNLKPQLNKSVIDYIRQNGENTPFKSLVEELLP